MSFTVKDMHREGGLTSYEGEWGSRVASFTGHALESSKMIERGVDSYFFLEGKADPEVL